MNMREKSTYTVLLFLLFPTFLYGYIDLGTGSYVIQVVLGAVVGLAYTIKVKWVAIKTFFSKNGTQDSR